MRFFSIPLAVGILSVALPVTAFAAAPTLSSGNIQLQGTSVRFKTPAVWGKLRAARVRARMIQSGNGHTGEFVDEASVGDEMPARTKIFAGYPYSADTQWRAPSISLGVYPDTFTDDQYAPEPGSYTKEFKKDALDRLLKIFDNRGKTSIPPEQKRMIHIGNDYPTDLPKEIGAWWGNYMTITDRIQPRYLSNADGSLRGVGFFVSEGQDSNFDPFYRVILANREHHAVLVASLPLSRFAELEPFKIDPESTPEEMSADIAAGYAYLGAPKSYDKTPLGAFMKQVDAFVSSLTIRGR